jgi:Flp pilus assembly protein TadG
MADIQGTRKTPLRSRRLQLKVVKRFYRQEDGSAAIEFGVVALPFFGMLFAIIETALVFFANQILETANGDAARLIMTGQAQNASFDLNTYKTDLCNRIKGLMSCAGISIDVKSYGQFSNADFSRPVNAQGELQKAGFSFNPGTAGDIVVVRAFYEFPIFTSMLGLNLADMKGGKRLLISTATFRNEPFK